MEVVTLSVRKTFNDRQVQVNLRKALPGVLSLMNDNTSIFGISLTRGADEQITSLELGEWVLFEDKLVHASDPRVASGMFPGKLSTYVLTKYLAPTDHEEAAGELLGECSKHFCERVLAFYRARSNPQRTLPTPIDDTLDSMLALDELRNNSEITNPAPLPPKRHSLNVWV